MNNKHTLQMLRDSCLSLGRIVTPQAKVLNIEIFDDNGKFAAVLMTSKSDIEVGSGDSERAATYHLMTRLCQRVLKL